MIAIPRFVFRLFRSVGRRAGLHKRRLTSEWGLSITGDGQCIRLRAGGCDVALEYRHVGSSDSQTLTLPWEALDALAGRGNEPVSLDAQGPTVTIASWNDGGVPRQSRFDAPKLDKLKFPEPPQEFTANEPGLWRALRDAVPICDRESTRYALGCVHTRGSLGRIDATDGRHVLTQAGFQFPWQEDLLLPGNGVLGCRELDANDSIGVGRTEKWVGFRTGDWLLMLAVQEGRFPKVDEILPKPETAKSRLELAPTDAEFLADVLPRLPCDDPQHEPITCDLNGRVLIRARESATSRPTQVELKESRLHGEPVILNTNRKYVAHALRLGFRNVHCFGLGSAALCGDALRRYLWMPLDHESAIKSHPDPIRIERSSFVSSTVSKPSTSEKPMSVKSNAERPATHKQAASSVAAETNHAVADRTVVSPIEQTLVLRDALRTAAQQANDLVRSLKRQKRHTRIVESTLASLKELQKVAG